VTQARGALQAAQANFNRTIVRAPIAGTVTALPVRVGDNVAPQALVVELINDSAIEIVTFINASDQAQFIVGDAVEFRPTGTGTITAVAERIGERTGKIEMRIASNEGMLTPGDTVRIIPKSTALASTTTATTTAPDITLPLSAIRFVGDTANIMVVVDGKIVLQPVTVGAIRGNRIVILDGVTPETVLITDTRGKQVGQTVTPNQIN